MKGKNKIFALFVIFLLVETILGSSIVMAQSTLSGGGSGSGRSFSSTSSARYTSNQYRPNYQTYYGQQTVNEYWPILGDRETCEGRQDLLLGVAPLGCQPVVVRSDLLAEQNVPVFCQIDAAKINPLIDIKQIRNVRFIGNYPAVVAGVGFHPARAALRTKDNLLGSPLINNIGYVVVILKRQPIEDKLPDNVNLTLAAQIEYNAGNAYGVGKTEFSLEEVADVNWDREKLKNSFWNGRYFVRLENVETNFADVSIYNGDRKIVTSRVEKGKESRDLYLPGMYCRAALKISYDGYVTSDKRARIEVTSDLGTDQFDVTEGSNFADSCSISRIDINVDGRTGKVSGSCSGERFELSLGNATINSTNSGIKIDGKVVDKLFLSEVYTGNEEKNINIYKDNAKQQPLIGMSIKRLELLKNNIQIGNIDNNGKITITQSGSLTPELNKLLEEATISGNEIIPNKEETIITSKDTATAKESEKYYQEAIKYYIEVADDFPNEPGNASIDQNYGEEALIKAIGLSRIFGNTNDRRMLVNKYLEIYPDGNNAAGYLNELNNLGNYDYSQSTILIEFNDRTKSIRLVNLEKPNEDASADLYIEGRKEIIKVNDIKTLYSSGATVGNISLQSVDAEQVRINYYCIRGRNSGTEILEIDKDGKPICGVNVKLDSVKSAEIAKIRLSPFASGTQTLTNFSVNIGIEKRAIKLNPDKAQEKIDRLNETIKKWEDISKKLGNVVSGLKAACFATSAALTFKNFFAGLSGKSLARQQVMSGEHGWSSTCGKIISGEIVNPKGYKTLDQCFLGEADKIEKDVSVRTKAIEEVNAEFKKIQNEEKNKPAGAGSVFGTYINEDGAKKKLAEKINTEYGKTEVDLGGDKWSYLDTNRKVQYKRNPTYSEIYKDAGTYSNDQLREAMLYAKLTKEGSGLSEEQKLNLQSEIRDTALRINSNREIDRDIQNQAKYSEENLATPLSLEGEGQKTRVSNVIGLNDKVKGDYQLGEKSTHTTTVRVNAYNNNNIKSGGKPVQFEPGVYVLGLEQIDPISGEYAVTSVSKKEANGKLEKTVDVKDFTNAYNIGAIKAADRLSYMNEIAPQYREVKYYETEPYKGMPAIVPFDIKAGWYAGTRQTLPVFGGIGAFDKSGKVTSFWVCNVGENKRVEFESGLGDDICQQVNLNTGQPLGYFPGLEESKARKLINDAINAITDAANQYESASKTKYVTINGQKLKVGKPAVNLPGTKCQDFMSPKDCHLMFNVCDPVVCPSSRCDFGGTYPVANVAQTGIVGSALLCLPNIKEGIVIPVCLTGIKAGIDGLISIMKSYRDCLTENIKTGQLVGICDQMYSIYLCDFFWGQVAPFVSTLVPKLLEMAYGQGTRGGAEYLTVNAAWQNMEQSVNYFTQSYAQNSLKSFQSRTGEKFGSNYILEGGVSEIGAQMCKSFISAKAPNTFKALIESDSPPQFHAWFDAKTFTTVTVPATAQYKVFYHIFAGNDAGVHFSVYLKSAPESSYYSIAPTVAVGSGFIAKGESADNTKDFTAPEGYKELCVRINNEEECGFKQVTSSFALNQIADSYAADQIKNSNIQSEKECISGSSDVRTLINPNIQAGVQESAFPQSYNRGIVRICSTENPGKSTDPSRFSDMGYCGSEKVRCWLDKQSVNNAITESNIGVRNETLTYLENRTIEALKKSGEILVDEAFANEFDNLNKDFNLINGQNGQNIKVVASDLVTRIDAVYSKALLNKDKAKLILLKAEVFDRVAQQLRFGEDKINSDAIVATPGSTTGGSTTSTNTDTTISENADDKLTLGVIDKDGNKPIIDNGEETKYLVGSDNIVYFEDDIKQETRKIGYVDDFGEIILDDPTSQDTVLIEGRSIPELNKNEIVNNEKCEIKSTEIIDFNTKRVINEEVSSGQEIGIKINGEGCKNKKLDYEIWFMNKLLGYVDWMEPDTQLNEQKVNDKIPTEFSWVAQYRPNFKDNYYYISIKDDKETLLDVSSKFKIVDKKEEEKVEENYIPQQFALDNLVIRRENSRVNFYYKENGKETPTGLFILYGSSEISYQNTETRVADLGRKISDLGVIGDGLKITVYSPSSGTSILDGKFTLDELDGKYLINTGGVNYKIQDETVPAENSYSEDHYYIVSEYVNHVLKEKIYLNGESTDIFLTGDIIYIEKETSNYGSVENGELIVSLYKITKDKSYFIHAQNLNGKEYDDLKNGNIKFVE